MVGYYQGAQVETYDQDFASHCIDSDGCGLGYIELDPALYEMT
jgi:hypothetical protein